jgi:alanine dehydrogenase
MRDLRRPEQASHNGEPAHALRDGCARPGRRHGARRGAGGDAPGRRGDDEVTAFDSTGLAIRDLAIALAALERVGELDLAAVDL